MKKNCYPENAQRVLLSLRLFCMFLLAGCLISLNSFSQTTLIDPTGDGGFNNGTTFASNGWTVANSANNPWFVGTGVATAPFAGRSAYISNNGGTSNTYTNTTIGVNYFYRDITIPVGQPYLIYSFNWVCNGESSWDMIQLFVAPTSVTPSPTVVYPGSGLAVTNLVGATFLNAYQLQSTIQTASGIVIGTPGTTVRVIFGWKNDGSGGSAPSGSLDNISLVATSTLPTYTAAAAGGLWSSAATWAGGVVPPSGTNVIIPSGTIITVDQVTTCNDLNIDGTLQWNGTANAMTLTGSLTISATGVFLPYTTGQTGVPINVAGNFTNNGFANLAVTMASGFHLNFNGSGSTLGGSGTFAGDGTKGIIRALAFQNLGSNSITTSQNLIVNGTTGGANGFAHTAGSLNTNGKLTIDNTAQIYGQAFNTQVASVHVTNMGTLYNAAPVVFGAAVSPWVANGAATANSRYFSAGNVYLCTTAGTFDPANPPVNTTPVTETNGTATVLWIGTTGTLGNPFQVTAVTVGTQYFCGNNLYVCFGAGTPTAATAPTCTGAGSTCVSGTASFRYVGSPAKVSVNYDPATQTVRSLNLVSAGSGYSSSTAPTLTFNPGIAGGTGSGAAASAVVLYTVLGPANSVTQKGGGAATLTGGLTINSDQGASIASSDPQASSGVGNISTTNGGNNYTIAPVVGFAGPPALNLITNNGSGYTAAPTITVSGGNLVSGSALTTSNFTITVNQGKVVSVYLNTGTTACYSTPPTLTMSAPGAGTTAILAFPAGCWPAATANIGSNGQILSFTMTNAGYGYQAAPTVGVGTTSGTANGGTFSTVATVPTARIALYNLTLNFFSPALTSIVNSDDAVIPSNRKMNNLALAGNGNGLNLSSNLTLFGTAPFTLTASLSSPGNVLNLGGNTLLFTWTAYTGAASTFGGSNVYIKNGGMQLTGKGGTGTFTFPFSGTVTWFMGTTPTAITTGSTATQIKVSDAGAPTGTVSPSGIPAGTRAFRVEANMGSFGAATFGTNPQITLNFNFTDSLAMTQQYLTVAEANALSGPWTIRSTPFGVSGALPATGGKITATSSPGPIVPTGDNYYAWMNTAPAPVVSVLAPSNFCEGGGETVSITGSGFTGAASVKFNGVNAASFVVNNDNSITAITPPGISAGNVTVTANAISGTGPAYTVSLTGVFVVTEIPANGLICTAGGNVSISVNNIGADSYNWTGSGLNTTSGTSVIATPSVTTQYVLTAPFTSFGCSVIKTFNVGVISGSVVTPTATPPSTCYPGGASSILLNSNLSAGNFGVSSIPYSVITPPGVGVTTLATGGAAVIPLSGGSLDDGGWSGIPIGFTYNFFGTNFNTVAASTNGTLKFGPISCYTSAAGCLGFFSFVPFPSVSNPDNVIALMAADLYMFGGSIKYWNDGIAPTRRFIIQYSSVPFCCSAVNPTISATCILYETTGVVEIFIASAANDGSHNKFVALQNTGGVIGAAAPGRNGGLWTTSNEAWRFSPPQNYTYQWSPSTGLSTTNTSTTSYAVTGPGSFAYNLTVTNPSTGCQTTSPVSFDVFASPSAPVITGVTSVCGLATTTLTSSAPAGVNVIKWYDAPTGGTLLSTGISFTTPVLSANATYYVAEENAACSSLRTPVTVTWTAPPPLAIYNTTNNSTSNVSFCGTTGITVVSLDADFSSSPLWSSHGSSYSWAQNHPGGLSCVGLCTDTNALDLNNVLPAFNNEHVTVTVTDPVNGCVSSANMDITAFTFPAFNSTATPAIVCPGNTSQLSAGVSAGNFTVSAIAYGNIPVPGTASPGPSGDDAVGGPYTIPFVFNFFGNNYTSFYISTNGNIQFGPTTSTSFTPGSLPNTTVVNFVALDWADLLVGSGGNTGNISYWVDGFAPNRKMVISYNGCGFYNAGTSIGNISGQIWLYETTGVVECHLTISDALASTGGGVKTLGVNNLTGSIGAAAPGRNGTAWITTVPEAWRFQPPVNYGFAWTPAGSLNNATIGTPIATPSVTTTYTVVVTDPFTSCQKTDSVTVAVSPVPPVPVVTNQTICGAGPVNLSATGGPTVYWYNAPTAGALLSTGNTYTPTISATTVYYVSATNGTCETVRVPDTAFVTTPPVITPTGIAAICSGVSTSLGVTSPNDPNYVYTWNPGNLSGANQTVTPLTSTTYTVSANDPVSGCNNSASVAVTVNLPPTISSVTSTPGVICGTGDSIQLDVIAVPYIPATTGYVANTIAFAPVAGSGTGVILSDDAVSAALPIGFNFNFYGNTRTQFYISSNGFITFNPASPNGCCTGGVLPNNTTPNELIAFAWEDLNPSLGGTIEYFTTGVIPFRKLVVNFNAVMHHNSGNPGVNPITAQVVLYETLNTIEIHTTSMPGDPGGAAWVGHTMGVENLGGTVATTVTGRNSNNTWTAVNEGMRFSIPPVSSLNYSWTPSAGLNNSTITNPKANALVSTTYTVTVSETGTGCSATGTTSVAISAVPIPYITPNDTSLCSGDFIVITARDSGAYAGGWPAGTQFDYGFGPTPDSTFFVNGPGVFNVQVFLPPAFASCTATSTNADIDFRDSPVLIPDQSDVACFGASTGYISSEVFLGAAPYRYKYYNSLGNLIRDTVSNLTNDTLFNIPAGQYYIVVNDTINATYPPPSCHTDSVLVEILQPPLLVASEIHTIIACNGNSSTVTISATGGTPPYTGTGVFSQLAGTTTYTVTDANGCSSQVVLNLTQPAVLTVGTVVTNIPCAYTAVNIGSVVAGGTTPYEYDWSDGATTASLSSKPAGTFTVTVTDANGCSATASVTEAPPGAVTVTGITTNPVCRGAATGTITLSITGGQAAYTYLWNGGSTTQNRTGIGVGTYTVTVKDANNCTKTKTFSITQPATTMVINTSQTNVRCFGLTSGVATVAPSGGSTPYTYSWNTFPVKTTASVTGLTAGAYTCTVTDAIGCSKNTVITITEPPDMTIFQTQSNVTFPGGNNGSASVSVTGGTPGYTYSWNTVPIATTATVTGLTAGTYKCTITDTKSCIKKVTFIITEPIAKPGAGAVSDDWNIKAQPNPSSGQIILTFVEKENEKLEVRVMDFTGRIILHNEGETLTGVNELMYDFSSFGKGVYFVNIAAGNKSKVIRIVIQ